MQSKKEKPMERNSQPSLQRLMKIYEEIETDRLHKLGFKNLRVKARVKDDEDTCDNRMERVKSERSLH